MTVKSNISGTYWSTVQSEMATITAGANGVITVQFLSSKRLIAKGNYDSATHSGWVDFEDDRKYTFSFIPATGAIHWNTVGYVWHPLTITGNYSSTLQGPPLTTISGSPCVCGPITAHFLHSNRPAAQGYFDATTLSGSVIFTDDRVYIYTFNPKTGVINWDNEGNIWYRVQ